ncbi:MAG: hypothetical protein LBI29_03315 [Rickettsiales bacterium]|jgi:hypothetical protein|nr:hypothetical protein [Rickettsiales bacterium]
MDKFFRFISTLSGKKYFRVLLALIALSIFVGSYLEYDFKFINRQKLSSILSTLKERNKGKKIKKDTGKPNISDAIDSSTKIPEEEKPGIVIKKQLRPDPELRKELVPVEKKFKNITNIFLKLKILEDDYAQRRRDGKINRSRIAKEGDFVYYSMETVFDTATTDHPQSRFFMKIFKSDKIGKKLIGKKIGQVVEYNYSDLIADLPEKDRKTIEESINSAMVDAKNIYAKYDIKPFNSAKIKYRVSILDFIPSKVVKNLTLGEYTEGK